MVFAAHGDHAVEEAGEGHVAVEDVGVLGVDVEEIEVAGAFVEVLFEAGQELAQDGNLEGMEEQGDGGGVGQGDFEGVAFEEGDGCEWAGVGG